MARETINGISVPIPGTGEPANFQGELRSFATDVSTSYTPLPAAGATLTQSTSTALTGAVSHSLASTGSATPPVQFIGCLPSRNTLGLGSGAYYSPVGIETVVYDSEVEVAVYCRQSYARVQVAVDGRLLTPVEGVAVASAAVGATRYFRVAMPDEGPHTLTFFGDETVYLAAVRVSSDGGLAPTPPRARKIVVPGDSWVAGTGSPNLVPAFSTWPMLLRAKNPEVEVICAGEGGTGYTNEGPGAGSYTDDYLGRVSQVLAAMSSAGTHDVVPFGSINDDGQTLPAVHDAAKAYYDAIAAGDPDARIHVILPPPTTSAADGNLTNRAANVLGVRAAALKHPNVVSIIDPWGEQWLTSANRGRFLYSDNSHLTPAGSDWFARRVGALLAPRLDPTVTRSVPTHVSADGFARADGSIGSTDVGAHAYSTDQGTWQVVSGRAKPTASVSASVMTTCVYETSVSNVWVEVTVTGDTWGGGPAFRFTAASSGGYIVVTQTSQVTFYRRNSGAAKTSLGSWARTIAQGDRLRVYSEGSVHTVYLRPAAGGEWVLLGSVTDATHTGTRHGMGGDNNYHTTSFDNLLVGAL